MGDRITGLEGTELPTRMLLLVPLHQEGLSVLGQDSFTWTNQCLPGFEGSWIYCHLWKMIILKKILGSRAWMFSGWYIVEVQMLTKLFVTLPIREVKISLPLEYELGLGLAWPTECREVMGVLMLGHKWWCGFPFYSGMLSGHSLSLGM